MAVVATRSPGVLPFDGSWHCEICDRMTFPLVGRLISGARHRCRTCDRTVCDQCSTLPQEGMRNTRTCRACYTQPDPVERSAHQRREKYLFLVRHAQSTWNQNVDLVNTLKTLKNSMSMREFDTRGALKDVVSRAAHMNLRAVLGRDHPISEEGVRQTEELRHKIAARRRETEQRRNAACPDKLISGSSSSSGGGRAESDREHAQRYYDALFSRRQKIYCSPLLRALQTAHLVLPEEHGWGSIKLLKDAREWFSSSLERDCLGTDVGEHIVDRAMQMGQGLPGLHNRVDATDCATEWWSNEPETEAKVEARLRSLWRQLLEEDGDSSCVLVTHSNLIKALLMRFGGVDEADDMVGMRVPDQDCDGADSVVDEFLDESAATWQVVSGGSEDLRRLKVERLQNCGVLGLRCVLEEPARELYPEVDGWVDIDSNTHVETMPYAIEPQWVAKDGLLMFDSVLVK